MPYRLSNSNATWLLAHSLKFLYDAHHDPSTQDPDLFDAPTHMPGHHFNVLWRHGVHTAIPQTQLVPPSNAGALRDFMGRLRELHYGEVLPRGEHMGLVLTRFSDNSIQRIRVAFTLSLLHGENTLSITENYGLANRHRPRGLKGRILTTPEHTIELVYQGRGTQQTDATLALFKDYVTGPTLPEFNGADPAWRREATPNAPR